MSGFVSFVKRFGDGGSRKAWGPELLALGDGF